MTSSEREGPPASPYPIDASLFVARGRDVRTLEHAAEIGASAAAIFALLTTEDGMRRVYGIDSRIELAVGGPYEWYFLDDAPYGGKGGEGNQVLAWVPDRLLVFSWNAPPQQPASRALRTWVVVELDEIAAGRTRVRLTHLGFGAEPHWDETLAYFAGAWPRVLTRLKETAEA